MGFLSDVSRGFHQFRADVSGAPAPWDDFWYGPVGQSSASGMRVTPETAKRVAAVLACVNIISRNIAMMPVKIFTEAKDGGKRSVPKYPLYDVLAYQPNAHQTAFEFYQMMQGHFELRGNAYAEIVPGSRSAVEQLLPMHPDRVTVEVLSSGRLRYQYKDPLTNQTRTFMQEEVFHLRNLSDDGVVGQSTVSLARDVFGNALAEQDYTARFFQNDARGGGIVEGLKFKEKSDEDAFLESWQKTNTGANRHKTKFLPPNATYKEIGVKPSDAQLLDSRKFSRIEICSIFGVPPHLIGETEKTATYASVEQFNIMFAVQCLLPRVVLWEQAIQRDLILSPSYFPKFSMSALLRGDTASRYGAYKIAIENGWLSQNEVRLLEDLNPIKGGDTYWRPLNWAPLTQIGSQPGSTDDPEPDETTITDSGLQPANDALAGRLKLLAMSAAERCVRKETAALRKMFERNATAEEIDRFYADHSAFLCDVLKISPEAARSYSDVKALRAKANGADVLNSIHQAGALQLAGLAATGAIQ